jgi:hypothetical protein
MNIVSLLLFFDVKTPDSSQVGGFPTQNYKYCYLIIHSKSNILVALVHTQLAINLFSQ